MAQLEQDTWDTVVRSVPIPSVDLVIRNTRGEFLLGKRQNRPAEGTWFVPGGRLQKDELIHNAIHRIANEETGLNVVLDDELGWYEHNYDTSQVDESVGKHYVPIAFIVTAPPDQDLFGDSQHEDLSWFSEQPKSTHSYTTEYLQDAGMI